MSVKVLVIVIIVFKFLNILFNARSLFHL